MNGEGERATGRGGEWARICRCVAPSPGRPLASSPRLASSFLLCLLFLAVAATACRRDAEQSLNRAVEAWDSANYKLAAEEYERYLYQRPTGEKAPEARFQLANIYYFKLLRYDQARAHYTAFLEQNPGHANSQLARERLAEVLGEMGRSYEAIAEYENLNPQDASQRRRIRLRIADLYFAQRNYSQALTEYEKVIEQVPYDELSEQAYLREASIYHLERSQYQQALPVYEKLSTMSSDREVRVRALYALADCRAGLYQFDEAIRTLRAIRDEAEQADVSRRGAELELQKHEAAQARSGLPSTDQKPDKPKSEKTDTANAESPGAEVRERVKPTKTEVASGQADNSNKPTKGKVNNNAPSDNSNTKKQLKETDNLRPKNSNKTGTRQN